MSVQTEINRITQNIENTYNVLEALGCDMPTEKTSDNLAPTAGTSKAVLFKEQTLTEEQKTQARTNIDAVSETRVKQIEQQKADKTAIPTKTSQLTNDSGFLTEKPTYTASEVGADAKGTAQTKVSEHNVSEESHSDIRLLISSLTIKINGILDSEDVDLDQLSELVAYIKSNRTLIESVTTNKVNVSDIIDNLTTSVSNKPLSAKQGVLLKILVDDLDELLSGHMSDTSIHVTSAEKNAWNQLREEKVDKTQLTTEVNNALTQAKESGLFDGKDGEDGNDGYSPVRGTDYWTPTDVYAMETYCKNYINTELLGGAS